MSTPTQAWRARGELVLGRRARLPPLCIRCGGAARGGALERKLYWHQPWIYLLVLNLVIYAIVALLVRKSAEVRLPVCPAHLSRRRRAIALGPVLVLAGCLGVAYGGGIDSVALALGGLYLSLGAGIWSVWDAHLYSVVEIGEHHVRLRGAHPLLLGQLPEWPE